MADARRGTMIQRKGSALGGSRWRSVYAEEWKEKYSDLKLGDPSQDCAGVSCSTEYAAIQWGGKANTTIGVIHKNSLGRTPHVTLLKGHTAAVWDFEFAPIRHHLLSTASEDAKVKLWQISGSEADLASEEVGQLSGHEKRVSVCKWNPSVKGCLATGGAEGAVKIWDVEKETDVASYTCESDEVMGENIVCVQWNFEGSQVAVCTRDRRLRIVDPRTKEIDMDFEVHEGVKSHRCCFVDGAAGNQSRLVTVGFDMNTNREMALWDTRLSEPVDRQLVDRGSTVIFPFWDETTGILYTAARGDMTLRYYDFDEGTISKIDEFRLSGPVSGFEFIPKRSLDVMRCEIARGLRTELNAGAIVPVSFLYPKRNLELFHEDIFQDCRDLSQSTLTWEQWWAGDELDPPRQKMNPSVDTAIPKNQKWPVRRSGQVLCSDVTPPAEEKGDAMARLKQKLAQIDETSIDDDNRTRVAEPSERTIPTPVPPETSEKQTQTDGPSIRIPDSRRKPRVVPTRLMTNSGYSSSGYPGHACRNPAPYYPERNFQTRDAARKQKEAEDEEQEKASAQDGTASKEKREASARKHAGGGQAQGSATRDVNAQSSSRRDGGGGQGSSRSGHGQGNSARGDAENFSSRRNNYSSRSFSKDAIGQSSARKDPNGKGGTTNGKGTSRKDGSPSRKSGQHSGGTADSPSKRTERPREDSGFADAVQRANEKKAQRKAPESRTNPERLSSVDTRTPGRGRSHDDLDELELLKRKVAKNEDDVRRLNGRLNKAKKKIQELEGSVVQKGWWCSSYSK